MCKVVVESLKYIKGIPLEMTQEAISAGELSKGSVVGLLVRTEENPNDLNIVEVVLMRDEEAECLKPGMAVPLKSHEGFFMLRPGFSDYCNQVGK